MMRLKNIIIILLMSFFTLNANASDDYQMMQEQHKIGKKNLEEIINNKKLIGMKEKEVISIIKSTSTFRDYSIRKIKKWTPITRDFRLNRINLILDENNNVINMSIE